MVWQEKCSLILRISQGFVPTEQLHSNSTFLQGPGLGHAIPAINVSSMLSGTHRVLGNPFNLIRCF